MLIHRIEHPSNNRGPFFGGPSANVGASCYGGFEPWGCIPSFRAMLSKWGYENTRAGCASLVHLHRWFGDYESQRRLSEAGYDLVTLKCPVRYVRKAPIQLIYWAIHARVVDTKMMVPGLLDELAAKEVECQSQQTFDGGEPAELALCF